MGMACSIFEILQCKITWKHRICFYICIFECREKLIQITTFTLYDYVYWHFHYIQTRVQFHIDLWFSWPYYTTVKTGISEHGITTAWKVYLLCKCMLICAFKNILWHSCAVEYISCCLHCWLHNCAKAQHKGSYSAGRTCTATECWPCQGISWGWLHHCATVFRLCACCVNNKALIKGTG